MRKRIVQEFDAFDARVTEQRYFQKPEEEHQEFTICILLSSKQLQTLSRRRDVTAYSTRDERHGFGKVTHTGRKQSTQRAGVR